MCTFLSYIATCSLCIVNIHLEENGMLTTFGYRLKMTNGLTIIELNLDCRKVLYVISARRHRIYVVGFVSATDYIVARLLDNRLLLFPVRTPKHV